MEHQCAMCHQWPLNDVEIRRSSGMLCTDCMISLQGQSRCYVCQEFFTLDNLYVTVRNAQSVDICKSCSLATAKKANVELQNITILHPEEWHSTDGVTWKTNIPPVAPTITEPSPMIVSSQTNWTYPVVNGININPISEPKLDPEPEILEPKPRRLKMKET